jgi:hypothetical protein
MRDVDDRKGSGELVPGIRAEGGLRVEKVPAGAVLHVSPFDVRCRCGQRILVVCLGPATPALVMPIFCRPGETTEAALARVRADVDACSRELGIPVMDADRMT